MTIRVRFSDRASREAGRIVKRLEEHRWRLSLDSGSVSLVCLDPCPEDEQTEGEGQFEVACTCGLDQEVFEALAGEIDVELTGWGGMVKPDDVNGPAEYEWGFDVKSARLAEGAVDA